MSPKEWGPRAWETAWGKRAWSNYRRDAMVMLGLTTGEAGETWAAVAAKGAKRRRLALKSRRSAWGGASLLLVKRPGAVQITALALA